MDIELDEMIESAKHFVNVTATPWDFNVRDKLIELKALRAELQKAREQEPVAEVFKCSATGTGLDYSFLGDVPEGTTKLYAAPVPAMPIPKQEPAVATTTKPIIPEGFTLVNTEIINWMLGEEGEFFRPAGAGPFWWRENLRSAILRDSVAYWVAEEMSPSPRINEQDARE